MIVLNYDPGTVLFVDVDVDVDVFRFYNVLTLILIWASWRMVVFTDEKQASTTCYASIVDNTTAMSAGRRG